jgi:hypothetical protein
MNKINGVLVVILLVMGFFLYQTAVESGKRKAEVAQLAHVADSLKNEVKRVDTLIRRYDSVVYRSRTQIRVVDSSKKIDIAHITDSLMAKLDSVGKIQLARLTEDYEEKLTVRDTHIEDQDRLIAIQKEGLAERDKLIANYEEQIKILKKPNWAKRIGTVVIVGGAFILGRVL